uniref:neuroplastin-like n=1 Tax=Myxine glutinosa TaxID=7769 RepID=UPI00358EBD6B
MKMHAVYWMTMAMAAILVTLGVSGTLADFSVEPKPETFYIGNLGNSTLLLRCSVHGNVSSASAHWEKSTNNVKENVKGGPLSSSWNYTEFRIEKATANDSGIYTCVVKSAKGVKSANISVFAAPEMTQEHKKHYESRSEGESAILKCSCVGYPQAEWTWYKLVDNKYELVDLNMSHVTVRTDGAYTHLAFDDTEKERDSGNYSCKAKNYHGEASESIMLRVHRRMDAVIVFLIIVAEVVILIVIIFIYEKYSKKRQLTQDVDEPKPLKEGIDSQNKDDGVHQRNLSQDL